MDGWVGGWVGHVDRVMSCHVMYRARRGGGGGYLPLDGKVPVR